MRHSNSVVANIFVERHGRIDAKSYSGHLHCSDGILYSYSTSVAIWGWRLRNIYSDRIENNDSVLSLPADSIFLTENRYSQTTACHESHLRYSGNGQVREIPAEIDLLMRSPLESLSHIKEKLNECKGKLTRARKEYSKERWQELINNYSNVVNILAPISFLESMKWPERRAHVNLDFAAVG